MSVDHYTCRVTWSPGDGEYLGLCIELPSLSWLAATPNAALSGIRQVAAEAVLDMQSSGEPIPKGLPLVTVHRGDSILPDQEGVPPQSRQHFPIVVFLQGLGLDEIEIEREKAAHPDRRSTST